MEPVVTKVVIPKDTVMRLLKDIRGVMTDATLDDCGIIYRHSETDMLTGYACIAGPSDTLYFGGYYFFLFKFPTNYPHSPPIVSYLTNTNNIRFHPNFYVNKKVCVSIVNSWRGEQWSGCQTKHRADACSRLSGVYEGAVSGKQNTYPRDFGGTTQYIS